MQFHRIQLIGPQDLPEAQDWALAEHDGQITLFIKEHALTPRHLEEAWAAYRQLTTPRHPRSLMISQRVVTRHPLYQTA